MALWSGNRGCPRISEASESGSAPKPPNHDLASFLDGSVTSRDMIENSGSSGYGAPIDGGYLFRGDDADNDEDDDGEDYY